LDLTQEAPRERQVSSETGEATSTLIAAGYRVLRVTPIRLRGTPISVIVSIAQALAQH
jgi:hypothetical protein